MLLVPVKMAQSESSTVKSVNYPTSSIPQSQISHFHMLNGDQVPPNLKQEIYLLPLIQLEKFSIGISQVENV